MWECCPQSISTPVPDLIMLCVSIYIPLIKCASVSINGIKQRERERERERVEHRITTHRVVGKTIERRMERNTGKKAAVYIIIIISYAEWLQSKMLECHLLFLSNLQQGLRVTRKGRVTTSLWEIWSCFWYAHDSFPGYLDTAHLPTFARLCWCPI